MYCTKLEQAFCLQSKGRFAKRPSLFVRLDSMSEAELKEAFKHVNAAMAQRLRIRLGRSGEPLDWGQFRWALKEVVRHA